MDVAFGPQGEYGKWLRSHAAVVKINGVLFLHGGVSPAQAALACDAVNAEASGELTANLDRLRGAAAQSLVTREDGPLWYRGLALEPPAFEPVVADILARQGARAVVVGHTLTPDGRVAVRFGGKVVQMDTGMQAAYVPGGRASALEIRGETMTAIYTDRRDVFGALPPYPPSSPRP
jgi:hypothetical protein